MTDWRVILLSVLRPLRSPCYIFFFIFPKWPPCVVRKGSLGKTELIPKVDPNCRLDIQARQGLNENKLDLTTELLRLMRAGDTCLHCWQDGIFLCNWWIGFMTWRFPSVFLTVGLAVAILPIPRSNLMPLIMPESSCVKAEAAS